MTPTLELRDVRKTYGDFVAVDGVSLTVPAGSVFGLLGPNGAGKTTTIRMIMDIIGPGRRARSASSATRARADDLRPDRLPARGARPLPQDDGDGPARLPRRDPRPASSAELVADIERWLERVELANWAKSKIEELSKGMQQKVQLIGTVLHEPDLLILDEPFSGLDPINQELFRELLLDYRPQGKSVVLSTHGMELAERMCDHICLISSGRAVLDGELKAIKRQVGRQLLPAGGRRRSRAAAGAARGGAGDGPGRRREAPAAAGRRGRRRAAAAWSIPRTSTSSAPKSRSSSRSS